MNQLVNSSTTDVYCDNLSWRNPYKRRSITEDTQHSSDLDVHVVDNEVAFQNLHSTWNEIAEISGTHVFQTFEWNYIWWKYFGENNQLQILVFKCQNIIVGIAPFFIDEFKVFNHTIYSCLRFIGSTINQSKRQELKGLLSYTDYLDIIIRPGFEPAVLNALEVYVKKPETKFNELVLDEVPEQSLLHIYVRSLKNQRQKISVTEGSVCPIVELDTSWDNYLRDMSKHARSQIRRYIKRAEDKEKKIFNIVRLTSEKDILKAYYRLVNLHQKRWNQLGFPGSFAEERMTEFLKEIIIVFYKKNWLQLQVASPVEEEGKWLAIDLMFKYNQILYLVQRSFDVSAELNTYAPGHVMLYSTLKEAIGRKSLAVYDFLRGDENYKFRASNKVIQNINIMIPDPAKSGYFYRTFNRFIRRYVRLRRRLLLEIDKLELVLQQKDGHSIQQYISRLFNHFLFSHQH